jgi:hypothetical protein
MIFLIKSKLISCYCGSDKRKPIPPDMIIFRSYMPVSVFGVFLENIIFEV